MALSIVIYGFVVLVDPYDTLPVSLEFEREPISTNARFSFPGLAAKPYFDSAIFGTSTSRLLRPDALDALFDASFVNLAMNSATAYEQQQIFELFVHHHPEPKVIAIGVDIVWCQPGDEPPRFTFRPFPPWLYDKNPWNDFLYLFNRTAVEQAGRQAARALGLRKPKYGLDGYTNFLPPPEEYDLAKVRQGLYGGNPPSRHAPETPPDDADMYVSQLRFPALRRLDEMLKSLPNASRKVIFFVPYHHYHQPAQGSRGALAWQTCKNKVGEIAHRYTNAHVIDFMIPSEITLEDRNYWDPLHFTTGVASIVERALFEAVTLRQPKQGVYDYVRAETDAIR